MMGPDFADAASQMSPNVIFAKVNTELAKDTAAKFDIRSIPNIAEKLLALNPEIIGFSVYIWNITEVTELVTLLKQISPTTTIVLGGPEVSHLPDKPHVVDLADYTIKGPGEISFRTLCEQILNGQKPLNKVD
ncbi:hypothetical protein GQR58_020384 [Nymphon striatum]|nr:hypothetical protein GQR58_020384 [Nymphon striatum]